MNSSSPVAAGSRRPGHPARLAVLLGLLVLALGNTPARSAPQSEPRILLHARRASLGPTCTPPLANCQQAEITGLLYSPSGIGSYYVYLLAARYEPAPGAREFEVGIEYDRTTGSGVDIFQWNLCADGETPGDGWYQGGGSNVLAWSAEHCRTDSTAVGGYFYLTAYTPGHLALVPPATGPARVTDCAGASQEVGPSGLGYIGFGGLPGCNPCLGPCDFVPTARRTWSSVKRLVDSR